MRFAQVMIAAAAVTLMGGAWANAQPKIYAYNSSQNYCPAGLQPVTLDGTICCGRPNQPATYQQVMSHPVKRTYVRRTSRANCPVGTKGCTFD